MTWRKVVHELTRERNSPIDNPNHERTQLYIRGLVMLGSGALFCCANASIGMPVVGIGVVLIRMANKPPRVSATVSGSVPTEVATQRMYVEPKRTTCPQCGRSHVTRLSTYFDRYTTVAMHNRPARVRRIHKCRCGRRFTYTLERRPPH